MSKKRIYQPTDIVLAKVKGFPAWPAMIVPEEIAPTNVLRERPGRPTIEEVDEQDDNNYIIYSEALKFRKNFKPHNSYCVKFFCDDSYIWLKPVDFKPLTPEQCDAWLNKSAKKTKKLIPAFEMARRGTEGPDGIDVWEFIEYGSQGKPEEEPYVEPVEDKLLEDEIDEESVASEPPSLGSDSEFEDENVRSRRSRGSQRSQRTRKRAIDEPLEYQELKEEPKPKSKKKQVKKIEVEKYKFEDDGDWSIVGLGPQEDPSISNSNSLVKKLSQKKNLEIHNELKADLRMRLNFVNKQLVDILQSEQNSDPDDFNVLYDEMEQCSALRGSQDELITVFFSDQELVINFASLLNLKQQQLRDLDLYDKFQQWFSQIYGDIIVPDRISWSPDKINELKPKSQDPQPPLVKNETVSTQVPINSH